MDHRHPAHRGGLPATSPAPGPPYFWTGDFPTGAASIGAVPPADSAVWAASVSAMGDSVSAGSEVEVPVASGV